MFDLPTIEKNLTKGAYFEEYNPQNGRYDVRYLRVRVYYPIILKERLQEVIKREAGNQLLGWRGFSLKGSELIVDLEIPTRSTGDVVDNSKQNIEKTIEYKNADVVRLNGWLKHQIGKYAYERKKQIENKRNAIRELARTSTIPLIIKSPNSALTVDLSIKREIKELIPDQSALGKEEIQLDHGQVMQMLNVIQNAGFWFERTPIVFSKLQEEPLRDILLGGMNMIFQGAAVGEAFSHTGDTDIFLRISKGQILIAECKIWKGEDYYKSAISQILKYLTWRENYGVVITFSKIQGFTEMLAKAKHAIQNSENYIENSLNDLNETHFQSIHTLPEDSARKVEMHHIIFNIPEK